MKFGVREICNVVFRAKSNIKIGNTEFKVGQPVLYIDSAKTSTLEGAATSVYATGGRGNSRLVAWEGEKTLTFTVEDALISPVGLAILSGAGLIKKEDDEVHVHMTTNQVVGTDGTIDLTDALAASDKICAEAPLFVMTLEGDGSLTGQFIEAKEVSDKDITVDVAAAGTTVMVDYYVIKKGSAVSEIQIDAENFAGYYYVEADTLFRKQIDGVDAPVNITIPNVKIQSNFSFSMASSGDPSTFTFTMDALPGYTYFNKTKKVLCVMQTVEDAEGKTTAWNSVMKHEEDEKIDLDGNDVNDNDTFESDKVSDSYVTAPGEGALTPVGDGTYDANTVYYNKRGRAVAVAENDFEAMKKDLYTKA